MDLLSSWWRTLGASVRNCNLLLRSERRRCAHRRQTRCSAPPSWPKTTWKMTCSDRKNVAFASKYYYSRWDLRDAWKEAEEDENYDLMRATIVVVVDGRRLSHKPYLLTEQAHLRPNDDSYHFLLLLLLFHLPRSEYSSLSLWSYMEEKSHLLSASEETWSKETPESCCSRTLSASASTIPISSICCGYP